MLYAPFADREFDSSEKQVILAFAKRVGLNQTQVNTIVSEAKARFRLVGETCPQCNKDVLDGAKFCPQCGASLEEAVGADRHVGRF